MSITSPGGATPCLAWGGKGVVVAGLLVTRKGETTVVDGRHKASALVWKTTGIRTGKEAAGRIPDDTRDIQWKENRSLCEVV